MSVRRLRAGVVGLCLAFAAVLLVEAIVPTQRLALLPWWVAGPWLAANGALSALLARLAAKRA
jgi:hypothetical protein